MSDYFLELLIGIDQLINALLGGWADETLSARAWRLRGKNWAWATTRRVIDAIFFWNAPHCASAYRAEQLRLQLPPEERAP